MDNKKKQITLKPENVLMSLGIKASATNLNMFNLLLYLVASLPENCVIECLDFDIIVDDDGIITVDRKTDAMESLCKVNSVITRIKI